MFVTERNPQFDLRAQCSGSDSMNHADKGTLSDSICSLMGQARSGCEASKSELLAQLRSYLSIVAASRMNEKFQAKFGQSDVVQQSIAIALEKFDDFRGQSEGELYGWAKQILRNEILQQQRALLSGKRNMFRERPLDGDAGFPSMSVGIVDAQLTPKSNAIKQERSAAIEAAIASLPSEYQDVIRLRNAEQLPFAEIGERIGKSENAATKLWFRALVQLRKRLEGHDV